MIRFDRALLPFAALALLVACAEPTLDGSDLPESIEKVRASLEEERRGDFDVAVRLVREASSGIVEGTEAFGLDGMTAEAVFAKAEEIGLRRDLVWAERTVESQREVVDASDRLARLAVGEVRTAWTEGERLEARLEVTNGLEEGVDTAWLRLEVVGPDGARVGGEDLVDFRPRLQPGESRTVEIPVTSEARRVLPPGPGVRVEARFTLVEQGGDVLLQEPSPEALAAARERLDEAERARDELRRRLGE